MNQLTVTLHNVHFTAKPTEKETAWYINDNIGDCIHELTPEQLAHAIIKGRTMCTGVYKPIVCQKKKENLWVNADCKDKCEKYNKCEYVFEDKNGRVTCYANGNRHRTNINWCQQDIFGIDIDGTLKLEEYLARCEELNLYPAFIYSTFSSTNNNKSRAIYVSNHTIKDRRIQQLIAHSLIKLYSEADKACFESCKALVWWKGDYI
jgi:hypothetical protein